jgi:hypothetical protein
MNGQYLVIRLALATAVLALAGCVTTRPPTLAHVHLGHALTSVHVTPDQQGYLTLAEKRAAFAAEAAHSAATADSLVSIKNNVAEVLRATVAEDTFGLKPSLVQAANHIGFAAAADDASTNVRDSAPRFSSNVAGVVERCNLIALLSADVAMASRKEEAKALAEEIDKLARQNLNGYDADGDGIVGGKPMEYGMKQLRGDVDAMVAREQPAYRTVDQWYLFNLVRLPNGRWVFDKFGRGGNIDGYK